jgi:hypothetical protein
MVTNMEVTHATQKPIQHNAEPRREKGAVEALLEIYVTVFYGSSGQDDSPCCPGVKQ